MGKEGSTTRRERSIYDTKSHVRKAQQLAFEIRGRRPGYTVEVTPFVIGCLGGGIKKLEEQMAKLIPEELRRLRKTREMQKIVLMQSETIVRKIISGIVYSQSEL